MSTTGVSADTSGEVPQGTIDMKLEVISMPVSDVDRAKAFYQSLGWRLDADIEAGDLHLVQFTPPHSNASIAMGKGEGPLFGNKEMEPGSQQRVEMVVSDIEAARNDLISRGVEVGEIFHIDGGPVPGLDPQRRSYNSYALWSDPDGNTYLLQEVTDRLPGRLWDA
jgi:catechol 2,3-dioxygenase-like lactoylglutathione lyase family enzyme